MAKSNIITQAQSCVENVRNKRLNTLHQNFPKLKRSDFQSDSAYREALYKQYLALRQLQYTYVCNAEGINQYYVSIKMEQRTGSKKAVNQNAWSGAVGLLKDPVIGQTVADSSFVNIPSQVTNTGRGQRWASCAVSSKALQAQICDKMGYSGQNNIIQPLNGKGYNYNRSVALLKQDRVYRGHCGTGALWNLIASGKVGPGCTLGFPSKGASSGWHAKTLIAVNYDENGNLKSYVLQGNNNSSLEVVSNRTANSNVQYGDINILMQQNFRNEVKNLAALSTAEIESMLDNQRKKVEQSISRCAIKEKNLFTLNTGYVQRYASYYVRNTPQDAELRVKINYNLDNTEVTPPPQNDNTSQTSATTQSHSSTQKRSTSTTAVRTTSQSRSTAQPKKKKVAKAKTKSKSRSTAQPTKKKTTSRTTSTSRTKKTMKADGTRAVQQARTSAKKVAKAKTKSKSRSTAQPTKKKTTSRATSTSRTKKTMKADGTRAVQQARKSAKKVTRTTSQSRSRTHTLRRRRRRKSRTTRTIRQRTASRSR